MGVFFFRPFRLNGSGRSGLFRMSLITFTNQPTIDELRQTFEVYTKALHLLVADNVEVSEARKTVCWRRLSRLHESMPNHYPNPESTFLSLKARFNPGSKTPARRRKRS
ncbi:MAG: DUF3136 domain-containing protein [Synechococcus sp.]